jgi:hypothetical protein
LNFPTDLNSTIGLFQLQPILSTFPLPFCSSLPKKHLFLFSFFFVCSHSTTFATKMSDSSQQPQTQPPSQPTPVLPVLPPLPTLDVPSTQAQTQTQQPSSSTTAVTTDPTASSSNNQSQANTNTNTTTTTQQPSQSTTQALNNANLNISSVLAALSSIIPQNGLPPFPPNGPGLENFSLANMPTLPSSTADFLSSLANIPGLNLSNFPMNTDLNLDPNGFSNMASNKPKKSSSKKGLLSALLFLCLRFFFRADLF